jgi:hypothetical protein
MTITNLEKQLCAQGKTFLEEQKYKHIDRQCQDLPV